MQSINIGLLLASSTIFPIAKDLEKGLKDGLKSFAGSDLEFEIVKEFTGQGDTKLTENAINKFFNYDDVDLVTGVISNKVAQQFAEKFKAQQKPLLVADLGGHIPAIAELNEYIFITSPHLWRHVYTLGNWGVNTFGKKGMFIGSVYDAGYSFSQMFRDGMMAADPQSEWSFSVPPMPPPGSLSDMSIVFQYLEHYQPDFIFSAFCGGETTLFLNEFMARGWHYKTKVLGLPYLLSPFTPLNDDITIYTTLLFEDAPEVAPDKAFYHLGFLAGKHIAHAAKASSSRGELQEALNNLNVMFNAGNDGFPDIGHITIIENTIKAQDAAFSSTKITTWPTFALDPEQMDPLTMQVSAAWNNPYLCI